LGPVGAQQIAAEDEHQQHEGREVDPTLCPPCARRRRRLGERHVLLRRRVDRLARHPASTRAGSVAAARRAGPNDPTSAASTPSPMPPAHSHQGKAKAVWGLKGKSGTQRATARSVSAANRNAVATPAAPPSSLSVAPSAITNCFTAARVAPTAR